MPRTVAPVTVTRGKRRGCDDDQLVAQVAAADAAAFGELYDRYCDRAYSVALAICRDTQCAEEVVAAEFARLWRSRAGDRPQRGSVGAWLLGSVRSRAIELTRSATAPAGERLADRLARLPDAEQEVITLAYFGQLSHTDIAGYLGLDADTVKDRMRVGLHQLQDSLEPSDL